MPHSTHSRSQFAHCHYRKRCHTKTAVTVEKYQYLHKARVLKHFLGNALQLGQMMCNKINNVKNCSFLQSKKWHDRWSRAVTHVLAHEFTSRVPENRKQKVIDTSDSASNDVAVTSKWRQKREDAIVSITTTSATHTLNVVRKTETLKRKKFAKKAK